MRKKQAETNIHVHAGQTLLIEREERQEDHIKKKTYRRWKVKKIYKHIILCEREVRLGTLKECFTKRELNDILVRVEGEE